MQAALRLFPQDLNVAAPDVLPFGMATLATELFRGRPYEPLEMALLTRLTRNPLDAGALHDLSTLIQLVGYEEHGLNVLGKALALSRMYRLASPQSSAEPIRLLMFVVPGNFMANMPVAFLLEGRPVQLDLVYVVPGEPIPDVLPEHDVAIVGIAESDAMRGLLLELGVRLARSSKPVLNRPDRIGLTARDVLPEILGDIEGVLVPQVLRLPRQALFASELPASGYPIVVRPCGSHAGQGFEKICDAAELAAYLENRPESDFFASPFVDYASRDGQYRKYRVTAIAGRFLPCHVAISSHWMVHYLNAGMAESAEKREEEAFAIANFEQEFGRRHARALRAISQALDLDYFSIDCAETQDGQLVLFEAGTAMIVHQMEAQDLYPYRKPAIDAISEGFVELLRTAH